jgi:hypothetical protein
LVDRRQGDDPVANVDQDEGGIGVQRGHMSYSFVGQIGKGRVGKLSAPRCDWSSVKR